MNCRKDRRARAARLAVVSCIAAGALAARAYAQEFELRGTPADDVCAAFPDAGVSAGEFATMFANGSEDLDDDGLPDRASLALVSEVACNPDAPEEIAVSVGVAYTANLVLFNGESATGISQFREAIALLALTNATTETGIKVALSSATPPITLAADYAQVTCSGGACMPVATRDTAATGEFLDFADVPRAANEPFAADGDFDGDGVTNLTEYNNILAQGGGIQSFVIAATSPDLDGTEPVRSEGGGCFIATAAFGTPLAREISVLRAWRDDNLLTNAVGGAFADAYYRASPAIAGAVASNDSIAAIVRRLLTPVIAAVRMGEWAFAIAAGLAMFAGGIAAATSPGRRLRRARGR